jgi:phenylalanyl-tRNA synthetase alpha chain
MTTQLTQGEKQVLTELLEIQNIILTTELAKRLNQKDTRVLSILQALVERGLVVIHMEETVRYALTQEGSTYLKEGLPEVRLFNAVKTSGGKSDLDSAVKTAGIDQHSKGYAISWCKRNGWLEITKSAGETLLKTKTSDATSELSELLAVVEESGIVPNHLLTSMKTAEERKLVTSSVRKSYATQLLPEERDNVVSLVTSTTGDIVDLTQELLTSGGWKGKSFKPFNVQSVPPPRQHGSKQPYSEFLDWMREIMIGLGFNEWSGPYVETEFWNFDTLFVPQDHVSREEFDSFKIGKPYSHGKVLDRKLYNSVKTVHENGGETGSTGWETAYSKDIATKLCLRAHTTPVSMRYLRSHRESPQKMFTIDRNFRSEKLDARHAMEFNQVEGIIMDKGLNLRDLMGYLTAMCKGVGIEKIKFKPGQFPFTEPSVETFGKHEKLGWIELGGSGIFRPEVTQPLGLSDPVIAWGLGSERLFMAAMGINDIRYLFSRDLAWLRRTYFVQ